MSKFIKIILAAMFVFVGTTLAQTIDWTAPEITITTEAQLRELARRVNGTGFTASSFLGQTVILGNDITLTPNWVPIGASATTPFRGVFDGNGRSVSNLSISITTTAGNSFTGFFGVVAANGQIRNLTLNVVSISATNNCTDAGWTENHVGGLAGYYNSSMPIENCAVIGGTISGTNARVHVGGLVERAGVSGIINSYATSNIGPVVSGNIIFAGGLVGYAVSVPNLNIINSYATGNVITNHTSTASAGGLVGEMHGIVNITNSYASGTIRTDGTPVFGAGRRVGGIIGRLASAGNHRYVAVYYNSAGAGHAIEGGAVAGITARTVAQLQIQSNFVGWDFVNTWDIASTTNNGFPFLIRRAVGARVSVPTVAERTLNSIRINAVASPENGQVAEYAINTTNHAPISGWQRTLTFSGLSAGTTYYIFARSEANRNFYAGLPSVAPGVKTISQGIAVSSPALVVEKTTNSITIAAVAAPANGQTVEYAISTNSTPVNWQETLTFTGLSARTVYFIFARSKANNDYLAGASSNSLQITTFDYGAEVSAPELSNRTHSSITITAVPPPLASGQTVEYAISAENIAPIDGWQDGLEFSGLTINTNYFIFARSKANDTHIAGKSSLPLQASTANMEVSTVLSPTLSTRSHNSITINAVAAPGNGQTVEYAISTTNTAPSSGWQDGLVFSGLAAGTNYFIFARSILKDDYIAGIPSLPLQVRTLTNGLELSGLGTESDPFQISTAAELAKLAELVNVGNTTYQGAHYILTNDLDLKEFLSEGNPGYNNGAGWIPIGTNGTNNFQGTFNGNGKVISNLKIDRVGNSTGNPIGLFGFIRGGTVRNLGLENADVKGGFNVGGIVGYIEREGGVHSPREGRITNSFVAGVISGVNSVGGIAGFVEQASVLNCYSTAAVSSTGGVAGGIVGTISSGIFANTFAVRDNAALNLSVSVSTQHVGRVYGMLNPFSVITRSNNIAFAEMTITAGGNPKDPVGNAGDHEDGLSRTKAELQDFDFSIGGIFSTARIPQFLCIHDFTAQTRNTETSRSAATCTSAATYWYSCSRCNTISDELYFTHGEATPCEDKYCNVHNPKCDKYPCTCGRTDCNVPHTCDDENCLICKPNFIRDRQTIDSRYGIFIENVIVSDVAKISVITPEPATVNLRIMDNLGNVVFSTDGVGAGFARPENRTNGDLGGQTPPLQNAVVWNLTNQSGRFVANGAYLIIVEATGISGKAYRYSARIGINR